jgi:hypothetical protein
MKNGLDSECYFGRHDFTGSLSCHRENCSVNRDNHFTVSAHRWFNPREGNTYHTVTVWTPTNGCLKSGIHYGYGSSFEDTAIEIIREHYGWAKPEKHYNINAELASHEWYATITVQDVNRKKDL